MTGYDNPSDADWASACPSSYSSVASSVLDQVPEAEISEAGFARIEAKARSKPASVSLTLDCEETCTWMGDCQTVTLNGGEQPFDVLADPAPSGLFHIQRLLASGGLGEVYLAHEVDLRRDVALKAMRPDGLDSRQIRARFRMEAEITGALEHPGIVPVYRLGRQCDGRPYYCMRLIQGESLRDVIQRFHAKDGPSNPGARHLELRRLLASFVTVCNTIAYAHSRGILHRDIKPANIMLGAYGETLVVDWGLAKPIGVPPQEETTSDSVLNPPSACVANDTVVGSVVGTPAYMSPEQACGSVDELGPASDIYSLGATLYTILTGHSPFGRSQDLTTLLHQVRSGQFSPPTATRRGVPRALEAICLKAMATRPEARYASARDLANDIERWLADEPVLAYPEPIATRLARWGRRHRPVMIGALVAAFFTLAGSLILQASVGRQGQIAQAVSSANQDLRHTNTGLLTRLALSQDELGKLYQHIGNKSVARVHHEQAWTLWYTLLWQHPDDHEIHDCVAANRALRAALAKD